MPYTHKYIYLCIYIYIYISTQQLNSFKSYKDEYRKTATLSGRGLVTWVTWLDLISKTHKKSLIPVPRGMCPFWTLLQLRMIELMVTTWALRCVKLQSNRHHQQTNTNFYRPNVLPVAQPTHLLTPSSSLSLLSLSLTAKGSWLPWRENCQASRHRSDTSTQHDHEAL